MQRDIASQCGATLKELQDKFKEETGISFVMHGDVNEDAWKMAQFKDWLILYS